MSNMTPSKPMTAGEINKACSNYRAMLEKHAGDFDSGAVQRVLGDPAFAAEQFFIFRRRVEMFELVNKCYLRNVSVDRTRTGREAIDAIDCRKHVNHRIVDSMPRGEGDQVNVFFFKPEVWEYTNTESGYMNDDDLEKAYKRRWLKPVDPLSLLKLNEDDRTFLRFKPNGTHWQDAEGRWSVMSFSIVTGVYTVIIESNVEGWNDTWWYGGIEDLNSKNFSH